MDEAIEIEQRAHVHDLQRKQRIEEKRMHHGYPMQNEVMSREEREARIWAFMYVSLSFLLLSFLPFFPFLSSAYPFTSLSSHTLQELQTL